MDRWQTTALWFSPYKQLRYAFAALCNNMFSIQKFLPFSTTLFSSNCYAFTTSCVCPSIALCTWLVQLFPGIPLEKLYPFVWVLLNSDLSYVHAKIKERSQYIHFQQIVFAAIQSHTLPFIKALVDIPTTGTRNILPEFPKLDCSNGKLTIITITKMSIQSAVEGLCCNDLYIYASILQSFCDKHANNVQILCFHNVDRAQIWESVRTVSTLGVNMDHFLLLPYTLSVCQYSNILAIPSQTYPIVQHFLVSEWACDSSSVRKNILFVSPFLVSGFFQHPLSQYACLKVILRWFCVSRNQQRGLLLPSQPGFELYSYLPVFLNLFHIRNEFRKYTKKIAKRLDNTKPHFLRGLQAFLQLQLPHFCSITLLSKLYGLLACNRALQEEFPQVWDLVSSPGCTCMGAQQGQGQGQSYSLNENFSIHGVLYPGFLFIYAMALSTKLKLGLRRAIFLELFTTDSIILPSKMKGIEHFARHKHVYTNYTDYCNRCASELTTATLNRCSSLQQFLNLAVLLEYRILHNPSTKASVQVNNVPLIKIQPPGTSFPLVSSFTTTQAQHIGLSDSCWVLRTTSTSNLKEPLRRFLLDEYSCSYQFSYNVLNRYNKLRYMQA